MHVRTGTTDAECSAVVERRAAVAGDVQGTEDRDVVAFAGKRGDQRRHGHCATEHVFVATDAGSQFQRIVAVLSHTVAAGIRRDSNRPPRIGANFGGCAVRCEEYRAECDAGLSCFGHAVAQFHRARDVGDSGRGGGQSEHHGNHVVGIIPQRHAAGIAEGCAARQVVLDLVEIDHRTAAQQIDVVGTCGGDQQFCAEILNEGHRSFAGPAKRSFAGVLQEQSMHFGDRTAEVDIAGSRANIKVAVVHLDSAGERDVPCSSAGIDKEDIRILVNGPCDHGQIAAEFDVRIAGVEESALGAHKQIFAGATQSPRSRGIDNNGRSGGVVAFKDHIQIGIDHTIIIDRHHTIAAHGRTQSHTAGDGVDVRIHVDIHSGDVNAEIQSPRGQSSWQCGIRRAGINIPDIGGKPRMCGAGAVRIDHAPQRCGACPCELHQAFRGDIREDDIAGIANQHGADATGTADIVHEDDVSGRAGVQIHILAGSGRHPFNHTTEGDGITVEIERVVAGGGVNHGVMRPQVDWGITISEGHR